MKHLNKNALLILGFISFISTGPAWAQTDLFSRADLKQIKKISTPSSKEGCLKFVATYSKPLQNKPTAVLDVDTSNLFEGLITLAMDVIALSPKKYEVDVNDPEVCKTLKETHSSVVLSLADAVGTDGREVLPSGEIFQVLQR